MRNQIRSSKFVLTLGTFILLSTLQIPLLADIKDRIEYKLGRILTKIDTIEGRLACHSSRPLTENDVRNRAQNGAPDERYDIIIVGAGTSGSLLTFRMAERYPEARILVLDVGQDDVRIADGFPDDPSSRVPNPNPNNGLGPDAWGQLLRSIFSIGGEGCAQWQQEIVTMIEDQFFRVPIQMARGATLGGTSAINAELWNRGTKEGTYDRWVEATDDEAFGFEPMTESYKAIENRTQTTRYFGSAPIRYWIPGSGPTPGQTLNDLMGVDGRLYLTSNFFLGYSSRAFNEAAAEAPLPGRTSAFDINLADVDINNPVEYGYILPVSNYSQADPLFPSFNPYLPSAPDFTPTPGYTYTPPAEPSNAKGPEYAGNAPGFIKNLVARSYAAPSYLYPILDNKIPHNVNIKERAYVTRLIFDAQDRTEVIGVEYVEGENGEGWQVAEINRAIDRDVPPYKGTLSGTPELIASRDLCSFDAAVENQNNVEFKNAYAKTDIWLCAGAVDNPALLLRSGIGPQDELEAIRTEPVDVRVDLPGVGSSLQDTMDMAIYYFHEIDLSTGLPAPNPAATLEIFYAQVFGFADRANPATASIGGVAIPNTTDFRIRSNPSKPFNDSDMRPSDTPLAAILGSLLYQDIFNFQLGLGLNVNFDTIRPIFDRARWGMWAPLADPQYLHQNLSLTEYWDMKSQGQVTINTGDVFARPEYAPNMGADEDDLVALANVFENTLFPLYQRAASKRYGPRGIATYAGGTFTAGANTITFGPAGFNAAPFGPFPAKPIVGNLTSAQYDTAGSLNGFTIQIVSGPGAGQINVITGWTGAPAYIATVAALWSTVPGIGDAFILNPAGATPVDSVEFNDNNHRNFVRLAHPNGDQMFSSVVDTVLGTDPFTTATGSTRITVTHANHGYVTGDMVKLTGVTAPVNGIDAVYFNDYHIVYVIDANTYDIILFWNVTPLGGPGSANETSPAALATAGVGGGNTVTISTLRFDEGKFRTWLKTHYYSGWHPCCSCRMGKADDTMAVVDTRGRVYCTKGVRCCSCDIFPVKPNCNTQAPAYGIAQRLFELVSVEEYDNFLS